jgi:hypothetical protein
MDVLFIDRNMAWCVLAKLRHNNAGGSEDPGIK